MPLNFDPRNVLPVLEISFKLPALDIFYRCGPAYNHYQMTLHHPTYRNKLSFNFFTAKTDRKFHYRFNLKSPCLKRFMPEITCQLFPTKKTFCFRVEKCEFWTECSVRCHLCHRRFCCWWYRMLCACEKNYNARLKWCQKFQLQS